MNRRDMSKFIDLTKELEEYEFDEDFSFFADDVTDDLKYKWKINENFFLIFYINYKYFLKSCETFI